MKHTLKNLGVRLNFYNKFQFPLCIQASQIENKMKLRHKKSSLIQKAASRSYKKLLSYLNLSTDFTSFSSFLINRLAMKSRTIDTKGTKSPMPFSESENPPGNADKT